MPDRIHNARRNLFFGLLNKAVVILLPFLVRMLLIRRIGADYLGLDSLFVSLLQVLNLSELGFASAIIYSMYEPIARGDEETICALLNTYHRIYRVIGGAIFLIGLLLLPFLPRLIHGEAPTGTNLYVLYLLYLFNASLSYWLFAYRGAILTAHQRADVLSRIDTLSRATCYILQAVTLLATRNYYLYVMVLIGTTVLTNLLTLVSSRRLYPRLVRRGQISDTMRGELGQRVRGLFLNKLCSTSRNAFDNIFVSAFLGLFQAACYSNYLYVLQAVSRIIGVISPSLVAGVGNSIVTESVDKNYRDMTRINFGYMWISGWCTACMLCLFQPFIGLSFGESLQLPFHVVVLFCVYFYVLKMGDIRALYVDARGLWWEQRYRAIIEALANLVLNYVLGRLFGITGIIVATLLSLFFCNFIWGSTIVFRHYFVGISVREYYLLHLMYACVTAAGCATSLCLCRMLVPAGGIRELMLRFGICLIVPNLIYLVVYRHTRIYREAMSWLCHVLGRRS